MSISKETVESGAHLFSRLTHKVFLEGINPKLFPEGPHPNQIIEVTGHPQIDKNDLLIDFIVKCIMPSKYSNEWKNSGAILINTEFQISLFKVIKVIEMHISRENIKDSKRSIIESALKNLIIINCYSVEDMEMAIYNLEKHIYNNENINLVVIDNINANYWIEKLNCDKMSYFQHSIKMFEIIQNVVKNMNILLIFIRHDKNNRKLFNVDYKIEVEAENGSNFQAKVTNYEKEETFRLPFKIETTVQF